MYMFISKIVISIAIILSGGIVSANSLLEEKINDIGGKPMSLSDYKGKTVLLVNIATKCGYTPQLKDLEALYQKNKSKGFVVLGVPSNDFGGQTPEAESDVKKFCLLNYGVSFPLTSKTVVKGDNKHPLIKALLAQSENKNEIGWNFEKFLIDKNGKLVKRYESSVKPNNKDLESKIDSLL